MPVGPDVTAIATVVARVVLAPPTAAEIAMAMVGAVPQQLTLLQPLLEWFQLLLPLQKHSAWPQRGLYLILRFSRRLHNG